MKEFIKSLPVHLKVAFGVALFVLVFVSFQLGLALLLLGGYITALYLSAKGNIGSSISQSKTETISAKGYEELEGELREVVSRCLGIDPGENIYNAVYEAGKKDLANRLLEILSKEGNIKDKKTELLELFDKNLPAEECLSNVSINGEYDTSKLLNSFVIRSKLNRFGLTETDLKGDLNKALINILLGEYREGKGYVLAKIKAEIDYIREHDKEEILKGEFKELEKKLKAMLSEWR